MSIHLKHIHGLLEFIEENLMNDINVTSVTNKSPMSHWEVQRVFKILTRETIANYIKKRRLSKSVEDLIATDEMISLIAKKYLFSSQESFSRAFKKFFKISPSQYRRNKINTNTFNKVQITKEMLTFYNNNLSLDPRIVTKKEIKLLGLKTSIPSVLTDEVDLNKLLLPTWEKFENNRARIKNIINPNLTYGVLISNSGFNDDSKLEYFAGIEVSNLENIPSMFTPYEVTQKTYAVFKKRGTCQESIHVINYIYSTWLDTSEYFRDTGNDFQIFDGKYLDEEKEVISDYYIPIKRK